MAVSYTHLDHSEAELRALISQMTEMGYLYQTQERYSCLLYTSQQEWDLEYVHQKTGEHRWFHNVAMGSEVNGKKKYILVLSDRTSDRKMNQALSEAVSYTHLPSCKII